MVTMSKYAGWIEWQFYPKSAIMPNHLLSLIETFKINEEKISTIKNRTLISNDVLKIIRDDLIRYDFIVENGSSIKEKIRRPVLFGRNNSIEKSFDVDAYCLNTKTALEVEAGRAVTNYQFLKDFFEACVMVDVDYLTIAVRKNYRTQRDFDTVTNFFDSLYSSHRFSTPLKGILIIGY